jgi:hypothetical protein
MTDLQDLLEQATDLVEPPGLAAGALAEARRRRARSRGFASALVAAAAVVVLIVSVRVVTGDPRSDAPPADPATPSVTEVPTAPAIARSRIQEVWDPRGAEGQPVVDLGVPRVLETLTAGPVDRPVVVLDDGSRARVVSAEGLVADLALPDGLGELRTVSLSPDGTRLAAVGISGFFWRPVDGDWRRVELSQQATGEGIEVTWAPDGGSLVLRSHLAGIRIDLASGEQSRLPMLRAYEPWTFAPDGTIVTTGRPDFRRWDGDEVVSVVRLGPLESLQRPVAGASLLAAARANVSVGEKRLAEDSDGLIAVDGETLVTRGFLRVPSAASSYVDGGALTPIAWLDDDTLLFTVLPKDAPKRYLMTWDVATGEVSRVSCWLSEYDATFATDLLARG